jgi:hypothetical protein
LDRLGEQGRLDWSRASVDTMSVRAKRGDHGGANPVDRGKPGSKPHLVCDGGGLPPAAAVTAANVNDTLTFAAVLDDVPPVRTPSGRRRTRPGTVDADKGYDSRANRAYLRRLGLRWDRGFGAVVRVRAAGLCGRLLQPALTSRRDRHNAEALLRCRLWVGVAFTAGQVARRGPRWLSFDL